MRQTVSSSLLASFTAVALVTVSLAACDKTPAPDNTTAAPSASASAGTSTLQNITYTTKIPGRGTRPITQQAIRGGAGATIPSNASAKTSEASTDRQMRKHAKVDMADCTKLPDNAAECDGNNLYFCDDQRLWVVDCDAEAKFGGATSGACFEGEKFIDCAGCNKADDGSDVCCDSQMNTCCDSKGACYSPK
jgi:hypothetical protein